MVGLHKSHKWDRLRDLDQRGSMRYILKIERALLKKSKKLINLLKIEK